MSMDARKMARGRPFSVNKEQKWLGEWNQTYIERAQKKTGYSDKAMGRY